MASFRERKGRHEAIIRRKNLFLSASFSTKEDAELWAAYKEDLIDQIVAFEPPLEQIITLGDAIQMRVDTAKEKGTSDIGDIKILFQSFEKYIDLPIQEISYDDLANHFEYLMTVPVKRGGNPNNLEAGLKTMPSMYTTFRKFSYLSTVYEHLIKEGVRIQNHPLALCKLLRGRLPKSKSKAQD